MANLTTLVTFNNTDGSNPRAKLVLDGNGNLFGTAFQSGAHGAGNVFEIQMTPMGYAATPTILYSFNFSDGALPYSGVALDPNGDLFGTTLQGGSGDQGTVFEIPKTSGQYSASITPLASFSGTNGAYPYAEPIIDSSGDVFGTTLGGGANGDGIIYEIARTISGYAPAVTLLSFNGTDGSAPVAPLIEDADGNLFGTTSSGGANGYGTIFEIMNTAGSYGSTPMTLASFTGPFGSPYSGLIFDSKGDLFGTTIPNGFNMPGSPTQNGGVFELAKTANGYAASPTFLVTFDDTDGGSPVGIIADANGNLFGTTAVGGANDHGTIFEIQKTADGYANAPVTLVSFAGSGTASGLIADAQGNLFGTTTSGGADSAGTVFEVTDSGFVACFCHDTLISTVRGDVAVQDLVRG